MTTIDMVRTGEGKPVPFVGLISKERAPEHYMDDEQHPMARPFLNYLDGRLTQTRRNIILTLPELHRRDRDGILKNRGREYGYEKYEEVSPSGLFQVVRTLSTPPSNGAEAGRVLTVNFIEPINPEDVGLVPGLYAEQHFTPAEGQELRPEHIHPVRQTYDELVAPTGKLAIKLAEILTR